MYKSLQFLYYLTASSTRILYPRSFQCIGLSFGRLKIFKTPSKCTKYLIYLMSSNNLLRDSLLTRSCFKREEHYLKFIIYSFGKL